MDPEACLLAAETAIFDREMDLAADALTCYDEWREGQGYEPYMMDMCMWGDVFRRKLQTIFIDTFGD
jgi:hypothetical protein